MLLWGGCGAAVVSREAAVLQAGLQPAGSCGASLLMQARHATHALPCVPPPAQLYDKRNSRSLTTMSFWKTGVLLGVVSGSKVGFVCFARGGVLGAWLQAPWLQVPCASLPTCVRCCAQVHGAVCFFIPYYSLATSGKHNVTDVYSLGKVGRAASRWQ